MSDLISTFNLVTKKKVTRLEKLLTFPIGKLNLAFRIDDVQKIIKYIPIESSGLSPFGVIHLEKEIAVIDLYRLLFKELDPIYHGKEAHFILTRPSPVRESIAILIAKPPSLMDVPAGEIRILPESYRRSDTLEMASHVTVISQQNDPLTIFILDVTYLLEKFTKKI